VTTSEVVPSRAVLAPLYGAGFVTAFGAHAVAASLGADVGGEGLSLWGLGLVLAVYDGAEVLLKPVFGGLADRWGPRPVLLGGLAGFALVSLAYAAVAGSGAVASSSAAIVALTLARFGQGAAASAFSPAAGAMVGRLGGRGRGRVFGSYGAWKGLGYTGGPLLGGVIVAVSGMTVLFLVLGVLAAAVAVWVAVAVPGLAPLPRRRQTLVDLGRRLGAPGFLRPTVALAATTAALAIGVGFLPVLGAAAGLSTVVTGAVVAALALKSALVQPWAGRAHDRGTLGAPGATAGGFGLVVLGFVLAALVAGLGGLLPAAVLVGAGVGLVTPVAFAVLAAAAPAERLGQTMGAAEIGRELGDAGGPLLVGGVASVASVGAGLLGFAGVLAVLGAVTVSRRRPSPSPTGRRPRSTPPGPDPRS
jgi:MFS family permease